MHADFGEDGLDARCTAQRCYRWAFGDALVVGLEFFVVEVEVGELFASAGESVEGGGPTDAIGGLLERRGEGDAGELAFEVVGELGAVVGNGRKRLTPFLSPVHVFPAIHYD